MFAPQHPRVGAWLEGTARQSDRERRHREAFALTGASPATFSPFSTSRGKSGSPGGRIVSSRRPSSAKTQETSAQGRGADHEAYVRQRHAWMRDRDQQIQGFENFSMRRNETAHRRRALSGIPSSGTGNGCIVDVRTLEDENRRLKITLHKATDEKRRSRAHRMRLESELLKADGKVEALLKELGTAPMKRDTRLLNTTRDEVERCAVVRTLAKRNERLQQLLVHRDREILTLKRAQEWSAVAEMTAATEEYVLEIQRLQRILEQYYFTTDGQDCFIKNDDNATGYKLVSSQNGDIPVAELVQSTRARVNSDYLQTGQKGSENGAGHRRRRSNCGVDGTMWSEIAKSATNPTFMGTSGRHRRRDQIAVDQRKGSNTELEKGQLELHEPFIEHHTTASSIRGNMSYMRVPLGGRGHGPLKLPRSECFLNFIKTSSRPADSRAMLKQAGLHSSAGGLRWPRAALNDPECSPGRRTVRTGPRSQVLMQTVSPVPMGGKLRRRRRSRPRSAPLRKQSEQYCIVTPVRGGYEVPTRPKSNRESRNAHVSKNIKGKITTRHGVDACVSARTRSRTAPEIKASGHRNTDSGEYGEWNHTSDDDMVATANHQLECTRRATATVTCTRASEWGDHKRQGVSSAKQESDDSGSEPASEHQDTSEASKLKADSLGSSDGECMLRAPLQGADDSTDVSAGKSTKTSAETTAVDTTPSTDLPDTTEREAKNGSDAYAEPLSYEHEGSVESQQAKLETDFPLVEGNSKDYGDGEEMAANSDIDCTLESGARSEISTVSAPGQDGQHNRHGTNGSSISKISEVSSKDNHAGRKQVGIVPSDHEEETAEFIATPGRRDCRQNKMPRNLDPNETCENVTVSAKTVMHADTMASLPSGIEDGRRASEDICRGGGDSGNNSDGNKLGPLTSLESSVEVDGVLPLLLEAEDNRKMNFSTLDEKRLSAPASPNAASDVDELSDSTEQLLMEGNDNDLSSIESQSPRISGTISQPSRSSTNRSDRSIFAERERRAGGEERRTVGHIVPEPTDEEAFSVGSEAETTQYTNDFD